MHRVAGQEDAAVAIVLGEQQVVMPRDHMCVISKAQGKPISSWITGRKSVSGRQRCMQGEFRAAALRDEGRAIGVDEIVVPPLAGDDLPVELVGAEDHLHQRRGCGPCLPA